MANGGRPRRRSLLPLTLRDRFTVARPELCRAPDMTARTDAAAATPPCRPSAKPTANARRTPCPEHWYSKGSAPPKQERATEIDRPCRRCDADKALRCTGKQNVNFRTNGTIRYGRLPRRGPEGAAWRGRLHMVGDLSAWSSRGTSRVFNGLNVVALARCARATGFGNCSDCWA